MSSEIKVGSFVYFQDDKKNWIFKAAPYKPKVIKKEYKEKPAYRVIEQLEANEQKDFENLLSQSIKDISLKLLSFSK